MRISLLVSACVLLVGSTATALSVGELPPISLLDQWEQNPYAGFSKEALEALLDKYTIGNSQ